MSLQKEELSHFSGLFRSGWKWQNGIKKGPLPSPAVSVKENPDRKKIKNKKKNQYLIKNVSKNQMAGKFEKFNEMNMEQGSWVPCTHFWILDGKESVKKNRKI